MTTRHLTTGDEAPPKQADKLRLYGMRFCPYVQRIRFVLNAKGLPYDEVLVNLKNKPDWLFKMHPKGQVPVLDTGDQVVIESLDIAEFLDEKHPEPALYPNPERKAEDKALIDKFSKVTDASRKAFADKENRPLREFLDEITDVLQELEDILNKRGTTFFSGDAPGMVDLMVWPHIEYTKVPAFIKGQKLNFPKEKFPKLVVWWLAMHQHPAIKGTLFDVEKLARFIKGYMTGYVEYFDDES